MLKKQNHTGLALQTSIKSGNLISDNCYFRRNGEVFGCSLTGWPQNGGVCTGNTIEHELKECLYDSGEPNWWKDFPGCTSSDQCYQNRWT